ncbi:MAG: glycine cleavage system aminomethyltransferase GcvT [Gammaproteobacteria bacterium]|nr:glycine cleavage system aminomethyltransferase GcvT [Gammaproteobacteria bacterium]
MSAGLARTPLHEEHLRAGGRMVPFAGYEMPVQYSRGIRAEHNAVRERAGLFDVSHMGEFEVSGAGALELVQWLTTNDAGRMEVGQAQYSALCDENGCVLDDLLVYRFDDRYLLVVNAANRDKDWAWVSRHASRFDCAIDDVSDRTALLALQGPSAAGILAGLTGEDLEAVGYYRFTTGDVAGVPAIVARTGYTGEDGFELYLHAGDAAGVWRALLEAGAADGLEPAGLGARDSLRLEMGYALYGNDLDEEHSALESGLGWVLKPGKGDFSGRDALVRQKAEGIPRRLVGLRLVERGFPRPGYEIVAQGEVAGILTSGTVSPSLGEGIAMGYLPTPLTAPGTQVAVRIRRMDIPAVVARPPFYRHGSIRR